MHGAVEMELAQLLRRKRQKKLAKPTILIENVQTDWLPLNHPLSNSILVFNFSPRSNFESLKTALLNVLGVALKKLMWDKI